ncbi:glucuronate isomerase [Paenibacillus sp. JCM 10914]|uniref:glucuronate isomerase n=1 Tax=Paenibacillus sp. JCM 10914 TaxID=1236974 RepID=UPI0003CC88E4|nr:glucuronate isomerase [Paenibacillus sp. JCM 10914]GAE06587.1 uronate isomerase [Paenibacillus sp. JCM 10914]
MSRFDTDQLLLNSNSAKKLYQDYAQGMPIFDYHNHLNPQDIANNRQFENLTELWLEGDHYKWRAMRWLGVNEELITGSASPEEKFKAWAGCVPRLVGNPLYHWTHLELSRYFGIQERLTAENAANIWNACNEQLQEPTLRAGGILEKFQVKVACTTDDPIDTLQHHRLIKEKGELTTIVAPAFRPDRVLDAGHAEYVSYVNQLGQTAGHAVDTYQDLLAALKKRVEYFHEHGCRLSDHGFSAFPYAAANEQEVAAIYQKAKNGDSITSREDQIFRTHTLLKLGEMYHAKGWTMQLHIGAIRNNNARMFAKLGKDSGYDSILDFHLAESLNAFLSRLDRNDQLPKTIVYSLYSSHYEMIATTIGNFQAAGVEGKLQLGSAWWFHDQKEGMLKQLTALSSMGLISTFVGMLTDSRSFMSFPRHEYFRRVLCRLFGDWIREGELPADYEFIGSIIQDICYLNAERYFQIH